MGVRRPLVYVLILNWNGWADTVECLESVFRSDYPNYRVIVCDNGSWDGSLERIAEWAEGRTAFDVAPSHPRPDLVSPPVRKPLAAARLDRAAAEAGESSAAAPLLLVETGGNLGYAGGNNVGLRYALARDDFAYVWLLNPDTIVTPTALTHLVNEMESATAAGLCGSTVLLYDAPHRVQAFGGASYYKWFAVPRFLGHRRAAAAPIAADRVRARLDMIFGASMLVSRRFLRDVGLMSEDYFLFFEELDWATRGKSRYRLAYAPASVVYHRQGRSTGLGVRFRDRSELAESHLARSRLLFTRKYNPSAVVTVSLALLFMAGGRLLLGQWSQAKAIVAAVLRRP